MEPLPGRKFNRDSLWDPSYVEDDRGLKVLLETVKKENLPSRVIKKYVTYRQINDWEKRLPFLTKKRETSQKWRRFSILDLLTFYLLSRLKSSGIDLSQISDLLLRKQQGEEIYKDLSYGIYLVIQGFRFYIFTDFKDYIAFDSFERDEPPYEEVILPFIKETPINKFVILDLKALIDDFARELEIEDFQVELDPEGGSYSFAINGIPLELSTLMQDE